MNKKFLFNPFNALYQDDILLSDRPEIKELDEYARGLEDKIEGDFNLEYLIFEYAYNQFGFVRNGLLLAKIKFLKLYKNYGDGTFASFCRENLQITRWQVNDCIKAARITLELMYAGFEILPRNISQAMAMASLAGEELVEAWRFVTENIAPDKITHKNIRSLIFPPAESDFLTTTIQVPASLHESIHREAATRGLAIAELLKAMLQFFISGENSHLLYQENNPEFDQRKEEIWRQDLANLASN